MSGSSDKPRKSWIFEPPEQRVGRIGEQAATRLISSVLRADDRLFTNVQVSYDNKFTELDNVVVNKFGVFIIEVKSCKGRLVGDENDHEWTKLHTTYTGNTYSKSVKNPIKQVKRQIHILAKYLKYNGAAKVWVEGYAILMYGNSPVDSKYILSRPQEIDRAIHTFDRNRLTKKEVEEISELLS